MFVHKFNLFTMQRLSEMVFADSKQREAVRSWLTPPSAEYKAKQEVFFNLPRQATTIRGIRGRNPMQAKLFDNRLFVLSEDLCGSFYLPYPNELDIARDVPTDLKGIMESYGSDIDELFFFLTDNERLIPFEGAWFTVDNHDRARLMQSDPQLYSWEKSDFVTLSQVSKFVEPVAKLTPTERGILVSIQVGGRSDLWYHMTLPADETYRRPPKPAPRKEKRKKVAESGARKEAC